MGWMKKILKLADGRAFASNGMKVQDDMPLPMKSSGFESDREPPARVDLRSNCTEVEDQSNSNSCCANAAAGALEYLSKRAAVKTGDTVGDISRLFIYYVGRKNDQVRSGTSRIVKDEGITLSGAANALVSQGACLDETWAFDLDNVNTRPPLEAFEQASNYKVTAVKMVPTEVRAMKQCLAEGYPIVFGCKLTQPFFKAPGGKVGTPNPDDPESASHGLHAMLVVGYSERSQTFIVRNSWGPNWGDGGYCYMPYDYIGNPDFNIGGMWSARGLTDYDFTPEDANDDDNLFDPEIADPDDEGCEKDEEDLGEDDEDPDGANDASLFELGSIFDKAFKRFDKDGSGTVAKAECKELLAKMGIPWFMGSVVFDKLDGDGSGSLSQEEFFAAFGGLLGMDTSSSTEPSYKRQRTDG